jgi:hypothetical protein
LQNEMPAMLDPLMQSISLPIRARFYPLGFPLDIATNSQAVLAGFAKSWRYFPQAFDEPMIQLRVAVDAGDASPLPPEPTFRAQKHLLAFVAGPRNFAFCDMARAFGFCWLTATAVAHSDYMRYHFLDAMVHSMLERHRLTSVHAACVAMNGRGLLLFGDAGAGKSCLVFACAKRGWILIGDDGIALVRGTDDNIALGNPYHIRFRESAIALFPELAVEPTSTTRNGEVSIELATSDLPIVTARNCQVERVVILDRNGAETAEIVPVHRSEALRRLESELPLIDEEVQPARLVSIRNLLRVDACKLRYGNFDSAVEKLAELVRRG